MAICLLCRDIYFPLGGGGCFFGRKYVKGERKEEKKEEKKIPPICTVLTWGKNIILERRKGKNMIFGENIYP